MAEFKNWRFGGLIDGERKFAEKAYRTQHPDGVFAISGGRLANDSQLLCLGILPCAAEVVNAAVFVVVIQRV